jgi:hypothetical protein
VLWWCLTLIVTRFGCFVPRLLAFGRRLGKERFFIVGSLWRVRCKPLGVVSCWVSGVVAFVALYRPSLAFLLCDQYTSQGVFSKKKNYPSVMAHQKIYWPKNHFVSMIHIVTYWYFPNITTDMWLHLSCILSRLTKENLIYVKYHN